MKAEIGKIPYLNGGLFDEHELEKKFDKIQIDDAAFERIFDFFDQYEWHLDTRAKATGKDINPDVIGYIFEKYINDRAQMGAYYTKEDITDYISKNCILPFLFDETRRNYPKAFAADSELWEMLKTSGDKYVYDAVKYGVDEKLPEEIEIGLNTTEPKLLERRKNWNKSAPSTHALPTEIWRETVDRRRRYQVVKTKIENGEIEGVNDFITYNLNITQFVQDVIDNTNDPDFLKAFYRALSSVTIIDPTCGSGAFLFAAMNILEPLYESSLQRMRNFIEDEDRRNIDDKKTFKNKFTEFRKILEDVQNPAHPNLQYFIYKSIILRNLYGVDIMNEAVEIAKLRLFLKLVATVEANYGKPNLGLEPLPDIDFNIRAGNTLVGYAMSREIDKAFSGKLDFDSDAEKIKEKCEIVARTFTRYKDIQLSYGNDFNDFKDAKNELNKRLKELNEELSGLLHKQTSSLDYDKWHAAHQPFHWFAEFYEIIHDKGGFDVIIGNPPYVEHSKLQYKLSEFETTKCGNLYAFVVEKCLALNSLNGRFGMIVPISSICTDRMIPYQRLLSTRNSWNSLYAERPSKLFTGAEIQLVITLMQSGNNSVYSTAYNKWGADFRDYLFENLSYTEVNNFIRKGSFPKIGSQLEKNILLKMNEQKSSLNIYQTKTSNYFVSYRNAGGRYYKVILNYEPEFKVNGVKKRSSTYQFLYFLEPQTRNSICFLMNSSLFFIYWLIYSDTWHLVNREIGNFPIKLTENLNANSSLIIDSLMKDLSRNAVKRRENRNKGQDFVEFTQFNARESKPIIDEIDKVLAAHYGFTEEELDFIINYDIKYRMGKELENE